MKKKVFLFVAVLIAGSSAILATGSVKTEKFMVYGNCGMCETRIEKAAKSVAGVVSAEWDKKTGMIEVTSKNQSTDLQKVHMAIAKAGHDTDIQKATDEAYNKLHGCCKYERKSEAAKSHTQTVPAVTGCTRNIVSNSCCN
jgi:periplasmic mercuric ion binding protein